MHVVQRRGQPQSCLTYWMNCIPERELAFNHGPGTHICNGFALSLIILEEDLHMDTAIEETDIEESNYTAKPHCWFHFYSGLLNIIHFPNHYSFPRPIYAHPLPTTASLHMLTTEELLHHPILMHALEPAYEELLETPIFDLNIAKLPPSTDAPALPERTATGDFSARATRINKFLKIMLDDISIPFQWMIPHGFNLPQWTQSKYCNHRPNINRYPRGKYR
uniref:Uncharacterized protein n=1 Tax=Romanomermis culicivorax TaxID=13658 RepID=A0A915HYS2_ROMCU